MSISSLEIHIFRLKMYIFRLEIDFLKGLAEFFPEKKALFIGEKRFLSAEEGGILLPLALKRTRFEIPSG